MARQSKKDDIATSAFPLLLEHGVKAMSIDMVVKASGVSKPTVYNHFSDKAQLVHYLLEHWLSKLSWPEFTGTSLHLRTQLESHWQEFHVVRLYSIFIGEGDRCPDARALFFANYHQALLTQLTHSTLAEQAQSTLHDWLMQRLLPA